MDSPTPALPIVHKLDRWPQWTVTIKVERTNKLTNLTEQVADIVNNKYRNIKYDVYVIIFLLKHFLFIVVIAHCGEERGILIL